jgi:hypothetical protein
MPNNQEWINEPDHAEFIHKGMLCLIKRHPILFHLCGYVGVPKTHPFFGLDYEQTGISGIEIHGGLTFSGPRPYFDISKQESDVSKQESDVWWFGFDCAHLHDLVPGMDLMLHSEQIYRNMAYVKTEVINLAYQLLKISGAKT